MKSGRRGIVWLPALAASCLLLLFLSACGGGDDDESLSGVAEAAPELADLGDVASLHSQPVSETFGPDGGEMSLADGATVEVPEGAFAEPTELTVAIVDVEVERPVEGLRVYHLSTVEDVGPLGAPVVLEAPQLADQVVVAELQNGEWQTVAVSTGSTTRFSIDHFSTTSVAFWECVSFITELVEIRIEEKDYSAPDILNVVALVCGISPIGDEDGPFDTDPSPLLTDENQAFINRVLDEIADELERAGASNENIVKAKADVRDCLATVLLKGVTQAQSLTDCKGVEAPYFPTAAPTETAAATESDPEPGADPDPEPEPEPEPDPEPTQSASITIVAHTVERRDDLECKATFELCTYVVTVSVSFTTSVPSGIFCYQPVGGGAANWVNDTNVPSGPGAFTLTNDIRGFPPDGPYPTPLTCDLRDGSGGSAAGGPIIATVSVTVSAQLSPPSD